VHPGERPLCTGAKPQQWENWEDFEDDVIENYVFGYGSLMADWLGQNESYVANLEGFERDWKATMDNNVEIPGYKCYLPRKSGAKPAYIAFVNITANEAVTPITGVVKPVSLYGLADLDRRERNYLRIDVTDRISFLESGDGPGPIRPYTVWAYTATAASLARHEKIKTQPVVDRRYYDDYQQVTALIAAHLPSRVGVNFNIQGSFTLQTLVKKML
jgi:hypothetical protein